MALFPQILRDSSKPRKECWTIYSSLPSTKYLAEHLCLGGPVEW